MDQVQLIVMRLNAYSPCLLSESKNIMIHLPDEALLRLLCKCVPDQGITSMEEELWQGTGGSKLGTGNLGQGTGGAGNWGQQTGDRELGTVTCGQGTWDRELAGN